MVKLGITFLGKTGRKCHMVKVGGKGKATFYHLEPNEHDTETPEEAPF
jgi:hypothetical protein